MVNQSQSLPEGQEAPDTLPTSTSGRVERSAHFRTGSGGEAELYERVGSSRSGYHSSPEVRRHAHVHMHACMWPGWCSQNVVGARQGGGKGGTP